MGRRVRLIDRERGDMLTVRQEKFCQEYVANGGNATNAYKAAYSTGNMKPETINNKGYKLTKQDDIWARISEIRKKIEEKSNVSAVWVRERLVEIVERCMQAEPIFDADGKPTGEYKFDSSGANKAIDTINRMQGYYEKDNKQSKAEIGSIKVEFVGAESENTSS